MKQLLKWLTILVSTTLTSCSSSSNKLVTPADISERILALETDFPGPIELGRYVAVGNRNTDYLIARQADSIPALLLALSDPKKPVLVGHAAYCMKEIKSPDGVSVAERTKQIYEGRRKELSMHEEFAYLQLSEYLTSLK